MYGPVKTTLVAPLEDATATPRTCPSMKPASVPVLTAALPRITTVVKLMLIGKAFEVTNHDATGVMGEGGGVGGAGSGGFEGGGGGLGLLSTHGHAALQLEQKTAKTLHSVELNSSHVREGIMKQPVSALQEPPCSVRLVKAPAAITLSIGGKVRCRRDQ